MVLECFSVDAMEIPTIVAPAFTVSFTGFVTQEDGESYLLQTEMDERHMKLDKAVGVVTLLSVNNRGSISVSPLRLYARRRKIVGKRTVSQRLRRSSISAIIENIGIVDKQWPSFHIKMCSGCFDYCRDAHHQRHHVPPTNKCPIGTFCLGYYLVTVQ